MNIETVREFVVLADTGNYEEAAFRLFVTQSTLSKHIQGLETELGGRQLLLRGRGGAKMTEFGEMFYTFAIRMVQLHDDFLAEASGGAGGSNSLRVGYPPHMDAYGFFNRIKEFCNLHPEYTLFLDDEQVSRKLDNGEVDIAILFEDPRVSDRITYPLAQDRLVPILCAEHPLAGKAKLSLSELRDEPFVLFSSGLLLSAQCVEYCRSAGFEPRIVHSIGALDSRDLISLVSQSFGLSIIPEKEARYWAHPNVSIAEPDSTFTLNICAQCKKTHTLGKIEREFIEFLQQKADN